MSRKEHEKGRKSCPCYWCKPHKHGYGDSLKPSDRKRVTAIEEEAQDQVAEREE